MRSLLSALMKEGVVSIVLLVILCVLVWFGGMYLETPEKTRIAIICVLLALWGAMFIAQKVRAVNSALRIEKQLKAQSGAQLAGADADKKAEIEALRKKFDESLDALKKSKGGKSALFTLPWYVIIGPPGSGKTTALMESGLNFPASQGNAKVRGIGGTRNCDWWFTEDGILLDTAGRYTTMAEDQKEWFAFLDMIKSGRNHKPINGAIVAIGMDELLRGTQSDLDQIAKDVRNRLDELSARLQAVFPVYVMFTKCDLLPGFVEFFEDFTKEERNQVWGMTFPYSVPDRQYAEIFEEESRRLLDTIAPRGIQLLASERPAAKKQSIYLFPQQVDLARPRMKDFIASLFHATAFQESAILRGIYLSSGTQKGAPIDQLMARMGAALGVEAPAGGDERLEKKSYFIHQLFTDLIFPDKSLARSSSKVLKKRRAWRAGLQFASVLALALACYSLISSFVGNREIVSAAESAAQEVQDVVAKKGTELEQLRALDKLKHELAPLKANQDGSTPVSMTFGMYQGDKLLQNGVKPYIRALRPMYIEPTGNRVKAELKDRLDKVKGARSSEEYQELLDLWRVYRMLGGDEMLGEQDDARRASHIALVASVLKKNQRWTGRVSGPNAGEIEELAGEQLEFCASLLPRAYADPAAYPLFIAADKDLVKAIGLELKNAYWESVAYDSIVQRASEKAEALNLKTLLAGVDGADLLEVRNAEGDEPQKYLNAFTQEAWDNQVKPLIDERARDLAAMYKELNLDRNTDDLVRGLIGRHKTRQTQEWKRFLSSIHPAGKRIKDLSDAREVMRKLAGDSSPYRTLFKNAWSKRTLQFGPGDRQGDPSDAETKALEESLKALNEMTKALDDFVTNNYVGSRFRGHLASPKRLETLRDAINACARKIRDQFPKEADAGADVMLRVVDAVIVTIKVECLRELEALWYTDVTTNWDSAIASKYPFVEQSKENVTLVEFAKAFNPKSGAIWRCNELFRAIQALRFNDKPLFIFRADYEDTIRDAALIRDAMFDTPTDEKIKVRFGLTLVQRGLLRSSSFQLGLDPKNGQPNILRWNDNRDQTKDFVWEQLDTARFKPGARVTASWGEQTPRTDEVEMLDDDWGLLRLLSKGGLSGPLANSDGKQYFCRWEFAAPDGMPFRLEAFVNATKAANPFTPGLFTKLKLAKGFSQ